jgi:hypothetical protein
MLLKSIRENKEALRIAIWDQRIIGDAKMRAQAKPLQELLASTSDFWPAIEMIEKMLAPLADAILAIEGSIVDVRSSYKLISDEFARAIDAANNVPAQEHRAEFITVCFPFLI